MLCTDGLSFHFFRIIKIKFQFQASFFPLLPSHLCSYQHRISCFITILSLNNVFRHFIISHLLQGNISVGYLIKISFFLLNSRESQQPTSKMAHNISPFYSRFINKTLSHGQSEGFQTSKSVLNLWWKQLLPSWSNLISCLRSFSSLGDM